ncbi:MAG: zinc-dependent peptidase [Myxococcales bacterium]|nr:zinc-dependent peptidase [Myxococcales bacterium]
MGWIRNLRRQRIRRDPFPQKWRAILEARAPFVQVIPERQRAKFEADLRIFEREKVFVGASGFEITEEVRVVISACAVRLVVFLDIGCFDRLTEIVVYSAAYRHPERDGAVLGEVSSWNTVVLSWADVLAGLSDPRDGHDTATHEFAHVLDRASGAFNGTPFLRAREDYAPWGRILSEHFLRLRADDRNARSVLGDYAATNEAEFFAVATEVFFERPTLMARRAPDLYEELRRFYGFDPAADR